MKDAKEWQWAELRRSAESRSEDAQRKQRLQVRKWTRILASNNSPFPTFYLTSAASFLCQFRRLNVSYLEMAEPTRVPWANTIEGVPL